MNVRNGECSTFVIVSWTLWTLIRSLYHKMGSMSNKTNYITEHCNGNIIKNGSIKFHLKCVVYMCSVHQIAKWIVLPTKKKRYTLHIEKINKLNIQLDSMCIRNLECILYISTLHNKDYYSLNACTAFKYNLRIVAFAIEILNAYCLRFTVYIKWIIIFFFVESSNRQLEYVRQWTKE